MAKQLPGDLFPLLEELSRARLDAIHKAAFADSDQEWAEALVEVDILDERIKNLERQIDIGTFE